MTANPFNLQATPESWWPRGVTLPVTATPSPLALRVDIPVAASSTLLSPHPNTAPRWPWPGLGFVHGLPIEVARRVPPSARPLLTNGPTQPPPKVAEPKPRPTAAPAAAPSAARVPELKPKPVVFAPAALSARRMTLISVRSMLLFGACFAVRFW